MPADSPQDLGIVAPRGWVAPGFEPLADVFARQTLAHGGGSALAVYRDGERVVDLVAGDYPDDPLQLLFSVTKSITALVFAQVIDEGLLDPDEPVGDFWPEFRQAGKERVTTRMVLSHGAGLPAVDRVLTVDDLVAGRLVPALEKQTPDWEPGTAHGYHAVTFGALTSEIFRRRIGLELRDAVAARLADPLDLDLWLGAPAGIVPRVSPYRRSAVGTTSLSASVWSDASRQGRFYSVPDLLEYNRPEVMAQPWADGNAVTGARDLARLFAATLDAVDGVRVLSDGARTRLTAAQFVGRDEVLGIPIAFGMGVQLPFPQLPFLGATSFGHEGAGGCVAFADVEHGLAVGYVTDAFPPYNGASSALLSLLPTILQMTAG